MEIHVLYPKRTFGILPLFSISTQKQITLTPEKYKGIMITPSKDPNNKIEVNINIITDQYSD